MTPPLTPALSQHLSMYVYIDVTECPTCKKNYFLMLTVYDKSEVHSEGVLKAILISKFFVTYPQIRSSFPSQLLPKPCDHTYDAEQNEVTQSTARSHSSRCTNCMSHCMQHHHSLINKINSSHHLYLFHIACSIYIIISIP